MVATVNKEDIPTYSELISNKKWDTLDIPKKLEVVERWRKAVVAAAPEDAPEEDAKKFDTFVKEKTDLIKNSNVSNVEGLGRSFLQGATFGAGKYAEAALETALPSKHGSQLPFQGKSFSENLREIEQRGQTYGEEHPIASTAANIAGNIAVPISAQGRIAQALTGAGIGAVQAASDTNDIKNAVPGALTGLVVGAAAPAVLNVAGKGIGSVADFTKRAVVGAKPEEVIERYLGNKLDIAKELLQGSEEAMLADVPRVQGLGRNVLKHTPETKEAIENALSTRSSGGIERGVQATQEFSSPYLQNLQKTVQGFKDKAQAAYSSLFQNQEPIVNEKISRLLNNKELKQAVSASDAIYRSIDKAVPDISNGVPLEFADQIKKQLDVMANDAYASNNSQAGNIYSRFASQWRNALDEAVPEYAQVRELAKPYKQIESVMAKNDVVGNRLITEASLAERLMQPGQKIKDVKGALDGLTTLQKTQVKIDLADYLQKQFQNKKQNFGSSVFSPAEKQKIQAIIADPKEFNNFMKSIDQEQTFAKTFKELAGGSRTDINTATGEQLPVDVAKVFSNPAKEALSGMWNILQSRANGINDENSRELANILINRQTALEALEKIDKKKAEKLIKDVDAKTIQDLFNRLISIGTSQSVQAMDQDKLKQPSN